MCVIKSGLKGKNGNGTRKSHITENPVTAPLFSTPISGLPVFIRGRTPLASYKHFRINNIFRRWMNLILVSSSICPLPSYTTDIRSNPFVSQLGIFKIHFLRKYFSIEIEFPEVIQLCFVGVIITNYTGTLWSPLVFCRNKIAKTFKCQIKSSSA